MPVTKRGQEKCQFEIFLKKSYSPIYFIAKHDILSTSNLQFSALHYSLCREVYCIIAAQYCTWKPPAINFLLYAKKIRERRRAQSCNKMLIKRSCKRSFNEFAKGDLLARSKINKVCVHSPANRENGFPLFLVKLHSSTFNKSILHSAQAIWVRLSVQGEWKVRRLRICMWRCGWQPGRRTSAG